MILKENSSQTEALKYKYPEPSPESVMSSA